MYSTSFYVIEDLALHQTPAQTLQSVHFDTFAQADATREYLRTLHTSHVPNYVIRYATVRCDFSEPLAQIIPTSY